MNTHTQFVRGWRLGSYSREHGYMHCDITRRSVERAYPQWNERQVNAYLNGYDDGWNGDTFRLHWGNKIERGMASVV